MLTSGAHSHRNSLRPVACLSELTGIPELCLVDQARNKQGMSEEAMTDPIQRLNIARYDYRLRVHIATIN